MIIYYNSYDIFSNPLNRNKLSGKVGSYEYSTIFNMFVPNVSFFDRTNTIKIPLKVELPNFLKIPSIDYGFKKSFSDICDQRSRELMEKAIKTNRKIAIMYSGGIDSTTVLCSFIKNCNQEELKRIIILLTEQSIMENPTFFEKFIVNKLKCDSSMKFQYYLGNDKILFLTGENADQLFGSQVSLEFSNRESFDSLFRPIDEMEGKICDYFNSKIPTNQPEKKIYVEPLYHLLKKIVDGSSVKIDNLYNFFWWINFTTKWLSVYVRILPLSLNQSTLKLEDNYTTFYSPSDFQLWALNNSDKLVGETPDSIKYVQKQYILDVNGDQEYIKKPKIGSLWNLVLRKEPCFFIDKDLKFHYEYPSSDFFNPDNDFVNLI